MYSIECNVRCSFGVFLSVAESKRNIDNDMCIYTVESLFPKPVLKPLNKKSTYIPCQDLKKKSITFWLVGYPIHICDALKQHNCFNPQGSILTTCRVVQAPQIQLRHRWSHRSQHLWVIPEQHRCRPAALRKRVAPCWGHPGGFT